MSNNCVSVFTISENKTIPRCNWSWFCKKRNWNIIDSRLSPRYSLHRKVITSRPQFRWSQIHRFIPRYYIAKIDLEPNAFEGKTANLPDLRRYFLPMANKNEFLIEKSPQYARGHIHEISNRARAMFEANSNMKLFAFVTGTSNAIPRSLLSSITYAELFLRSRWKIIFPHKSLHKEKMAVLSVRFHTKV